MFTQLFLISFTEEQQSLNGLMEQLSYLHKFMIYSSYNILYTLNRYDMNKLSLRNKHKFTVNT